MKLYCENCGLEVQISQDIEIKIIHKYDVTELEKEVEAYVKKGYRIEGYSVAFDSPVKLFSVLLLKH